jgi:diadenosine tetraphosphate (Ap4A) HIT family hydrolase
MVESGRGDTWSLLDRLGRAEHVDARERTVPAVHPRERWLARAFLNATPLVVDPHSEANGFVIGVAPAWHDADIVWCGAAAPGSPSAPAGGSIARELPRPVLAAVVTSWALLEAWADSRGLVGVPFVNGGKSPASGQSLPCFHAQFYALGPSDQPPLYELLSRRRTRECAVCEIVRDPSLRIATVGDIHIAAHPAPEREATLIVAPEGDVCALRLLPTMSDFAAALSVAARCLCGLLGGPTAYNIAVRTGSSVGHLHAELVPRSGVGVRAGFEFATGFSVLARDPVVVAAECRQYAASPASAGPAVSAGPGAG